VQPVLPWIPITVTAWPKLQLHQVLQVSLLIRLIRLLQLPPSRFGSSGSGGGKLVILLRELVAPEVFASETGSGEGKPHSLWASWRLCLSLLLVETGDPCGSGGISLLVWVNFDFLCHVWTGDMRSRPRNFRGRCKDVLFRLGRNVPCGDLYLA
jgi:hypothetical protein